MSRVKKTRHCKVDGGRLAYSLFGSGAHKAIFFHGHPGSLSQATFLEEAAHEAGIEVAAFDRPGFGQSDLFESGRSLLDLSKPLTILADSLGWDSFHFIAVSGGAPYALNSLCGLENRVRSISVVCGLGPLSEARFRDSFPRGPYRAMQIAPWVPPVLLRGAIRLLLRSLGRSGARGPRPRYLNPADFALLQNPALAPGLRSSLEGAFRQGVEGAQRDLRAFLSPWNPDHKHVSCPVFFWHGRDDRLVPCEFSEWLSERIPQASLFLLEGEGHYTLPLLRAREILQKIPT
ncbi:MAG: alpha/beta fold hydrolase [Bdellovibrionota bacterium]